MKTASMIVAAIMAILSLGLILLTSAFMYRGDIAGAMLSFVMVSSFIYFTYVALNYKGQDV